MTASAPLALDVTATIGPVHLGAFLDVGTHSVLALLRGASLDVSAGLPLAAHLGASLDGGTSAPLGLDVSAAIGPVSARIEVPATPPGALPPPNLPA